jgi:hypothetical protein
VQANSCVIELWRFIVYFGRGVGVGVGVGVVKLSMCVRVCIGGRAVQWRNTNSERKAQYQRKDKRQAQL